MDGLTAKQQRFVLAFVGEAMGCASEAARMAGYRSAEANAHRLMENEGIIRAISSLSEDFHDEAIATAHEIQSFLSGVVRGTECRTQVMGMEGPVLDPITKEPMTVPPEPKERVKAAEALAKMRGFVAPVKTDVNVTGVPLVQVYLPSNGRDG